MDRHYCSVTAIAPRLPAVLLQSTRCASYQPLLAIRDIFRAYTKSREHHLGLGVITVDGHDSSEEVVALFADEFGEAYRYVRVGDPIDVVRRATSRL